MAALHVVHHLAETNEGREGLMGPRQKDAGKRYLNIFILVPGGPGDSSAFLPLLPVGAQLLFGFILFPSILLAKSPVLLS